MGRRGLRAVPVAIEGQEGDDQGFGLGTPPALGDGDDKNSFLPDKPLNVVPVAPTPQPDETPPSGPVTPLINTGPEIADGGPDLPDKLPALQSVFLGTTDRFC